MTHSNENEFIAVEKIPELIDDLEKQKGGRQSDEDDLSWIIRYYIQFEEQRIQCDG